MRLLVVEDNEELSPLLVKALTAAGFAADATATAASASAALATTRFSAVILDLGLPDADGLAVLRELRQRGDSTPVLILTARSAVPRRVEAFSSGADDYLVKPFAFEELIARLEALLRRPGNALGQSLQVGNVSLDTEARQVSVRGQTQFFSAREVDVLEILMRRNGRVIPQQLIEDTLFGRTADVVSNAAEIYLHRVRKQLANANANVRIHTVRGVGYLLLHEQ